MPPKKKAKTTKNYDIEIETYDNFTSSSEDDDQDYDYVNAGESRKRKRAFPSSICLFEDVSKENEINVEEILLRRLPVLDCVHSQDKMGSLLKHDYDVVVVTDEVTPSTRIHIGEPMYLCKLKGMSHWHLQWLSTAQLLTHSARRLKNFEQAYPLKEFVYETVANKDWRHHTQVEYILHRE